MPPDPAGSRPPRVGYVLKRYPRLSETFVVSEILACEAAGVEVAIASLRPAGDARFHAAVARVRGPVAWIPRLHGDAELLWAMLDDARRAFPALPEVLPDLLALPAGDAAQALRVAGWVRESGVGHLHAHFATLAAAVVRLASRLTGVPYSFTAHAKDIFHTDVDRAALAGLLRDAHHVVTVSDHNATWLRDRFGADAARVHRVYNGVDAAALPWTDPAGRPASLVFVGRLVAKKGVPDLVDAVALLRDRGRRVPLTVVGTGPLAGPAADQVRRLGLDDRVTFLGACSQDGVAAALIAAAVLAAPCVHAPDGDRDGLPTVLLEAMALGTPCVSTRVTGIPEAIVDGETGLLVPERDPFTLADAIERLLDDDALRTGLARAARHRVETRFDPRTQAAELARLRTRRDAADVPVHRSPGDADVSSIVEVPA